MSPVCLPFGSPGELCKNSFLSSALEIRIQGCLTEESEFKSLCSNPHSFRQPGRPRFAGSWLFSGVLGARLWPRETRWHFRISRQGRGAGSCATEHGGRWVLAALIPTSIAGAQREWPERKTPLRGGSSPSQAQGSRTSPPPPRTAGRLGRVSGAGWERAESSWEGGGREVAAAARPQPPSLQAGRAWVAETRAAWGRASGSGMRGPRPTGLTPVGGAGEEPRKQTRGAPSDGPMSPGV